MLIHDYLDQQIEYENKQTRKITEKYVLIEKIICYLF